MSLPRTVSSLSEMDSFAAEVLVSLPVSVDRATVLGLSGDLGSGKTAFTKGLAKALDISDEILSPTFVIAKFYDLSRKKWKRLVHVDAYRIEDPKEVLVLRWDELLRDPTLLIVVEWPEELREEFPDDATVLRFRFIDETTREVR